MRDSVWGSRPQRKIITYRLEIIMAKKLSNDVEAVPTGAQRAVDSLNKQVYDLQMELRDLKNQSTTELLKFRTAVQNDREKEATGVVSFSAANEDSVVWKQVDVGLKEHYMSALPRNSYAVVRQEEVTFLPPGVDVCVTIRDGTAYQFTREVLNRILGAMKEQVNVLHPCSTGMYTLPTWKWQINGILLTK